MKTTKTAEAYAKFHEHLVALATRTNKVRVGHFTDCSGSVSVDGFSCEYVANGDLKIFFVSPGEAMLGDSPDLQYAWNGKYWHSVRRDDGAMLTTERLSGLCINWLAKLAAQPLESVTVSDTVEMVAANAGPVHTVKSIRQADTAQRA